MQFEDISPAFLAGEAHSPISSKDFQQMLYSWFEEKGLVADLRSYLRVQMINRLKNVQIKRLERPPVTFSLSKQAFNLIIGEHLLREGCHYTLSVFSTEIPPLGHQFPLAAMFEQKRHFLHDAIVEPKWRFDRECVENLLELVGISKRDEKATKIADDYRDDKGSLLVCIVNKSKSRTNNEELGKSVHDLVAEESLKIETKYERILTDLRQQLAFTTQQSSALKRDNKKLKEENRNVRQRVGQLLLREETNKINDGTVRAKMDELDDVQRSLQQKLTQRQCPQSCRDLQVKVREIEDLNREYSNEIKRLEVTVTSLTKDLEQARNQVEFLRSCFDQSNQINQTTDGGAVPDDDTSTSSVDSNVTEEILNQVKVRLKSLERESEELDKRFRQLKLS